MISSYTVGAIFTIKDSATPTLKRILDLVKELDVLTKSTTKNLAELGKGVRLTGITRQLTSLNKQMFDLDKSSQSAMLGADKAFAAIDGGAQTALASMKLLNAQMAAMTKNARSAGVAAANAASPIGRRGARAGGGGGGAAGGAAAGAAAGGHGGGALGVALTGGLVLEGVADAVKHAGELQKIQEAMRIGGVSQTDISRATSAAYGIAGVSGQKVTDVLEVISEIRNPLGGINEAIGSAAAMGDAMTVLKSLDARKGGNAADQLYNLVRSSEFRNAISGPDFGAAIGAIVRADVATAGRVGPSDFFQMLKYMRAAAPSLSDTFLYTRAPELAQEFRGQAAGTAIASLYGQAVSGTMKLSGVDILNKLGEVNTSRVTVNPVTGRITKLQPGWNRLAPLLMSDPGAYAAQVQKDMVAHGITDETSQRQMIAGIYGNRLAQQMMMTLMFQDPRLARGAAGINMTMGVHEAAAELKDNSYATNMTAFTSAWSNMLTAMGSALIPPAIQAMKDLTGIFNTIGNLARQHPRATGVVGDVAAVGGGAALLGGIAMLMKGGVTTLAQPMRMLLGSGAGTHVAHIATSGILGTGLRALIGGLRRGVIGGALYGLGSWGIDAGLQKLFGPGYTGDDPRRIAPEGLFGTAGRLFQDLFPSSGAVGTAEAHARAAAGLASANINITTNVKAETADPNALAQQLGPAIMKLITEALHNAQMVNQGQGQGSLDSPYTSGGSVR